MTLTEGGAFTWTIVPTAGSLRIVNAYPAPIAEVYVAPSSSGGWGTNQLPAPIPSGSAFTLTDLPAGTYDLRAVTADGAYIEHHGVSIVSGGMLPWIVTAATLPTGSVTVVNGYYRALYELYVTSSSSSTWGPSLLSAPLPQGASLTILGVPAGLIDLRAVAANGGWEERLDLPLAAGETVTWTFSSPTLLTGSVRVVNDHGSSITALYITPSSFPTWGSNQLLAPLPAGGSRSFGGVPAGSIDVRAYAADGSKVVQYGIVLPEGATVTWRFSAGEPVAVAAAVAEAGGEAGLETRSEWVAGARGEEATEYRQAQGGAPKLDGSGR